MKSQEPIPYEAPVITTYGTVRELTQGSGGTTTADVGCLGFRGNTPSGITCKVDP